MSRITNKSGEANKPYMRGEVKGILKLLTPLLPKASELEEADIELIRAKQLEEERIQAKVFRNLLCEEEDFSHTLFRGVKFENCRFWNCSFERAEFTDIVFQTSDVSGCNFSDSFINRTSFRSCKGIGSKFTGTVIKNLHITECNLNYANFDSSRFENVKIERTKLESSNLTQCRLKQVVWREVSLVNASFFHTALCNMDFSDSVIHGLSLSDDNRELQGAVVDLYQAAELAKRLGIVIKEYR